MTMLKPFLSPYTDQASLPLLLRRYSPSLGRRPRAMGGLSVAQRATRALVTLLLSLAQAYGLEVAVCRDSADADVQKAFRKVARREHPDRGGSAKDTQRLNNARDAWQAAARQGPQRGRARPAAAAAAAAAS